jgi:tRNA A37 methylthiotransferase MiaB
MNRVDVVIASLPYVDTNEPLMAPALLKGIVNKTDLTSYTFDFNIEIINKLQLVPDSTKIQRWFLYEDFKDCQETMQQVDILVQYVANRILKKNPDWICLSLFCNTAKAFNIKLCQYIKRIHPEKKIVIGGNGVFTDEKSKRPYGKLLQKAKLIDHYIVGDGDEPLYNLLTNTTTTDNGVDTDQFQVLDDLSKQPFSDYSDYDWNQYSLKRIPMYSSRGCVRRCTFCDVYKLWKKFKLKSAEDVFNEMLWQIKQTGISDFYFRDSLINGSISEYRKLTKLLADYNAVNEKKITWASFFIFRPETQMSDADWKLTGESGADELIIGVESLVDSIRYHMRKKFTNKDMRFGFEMAKKYNIGLTLLLIIGYVNETEKDFEESLQWLHDHKEFATMPIRYLSAGGTLTVTDLSDLYQNAEDFDITLGDKIYLWENKSINLTFEVREKRKEIFTNLANSLGYKILVHEQPVS